MNPIVTASGSAHASASPMRAGAASASTPPPAAPSALAAPPAPAPAQRAGLPLWMATLGLMMALVAGANGLLVWLSARGHRDLVRKDYYEDGLAQDRHIALAEAGAAADPAPGLRREGARWRLENAAGASPAEGCRLRFYRPDDGRADREVRMEKAPSGPGREAWYGPAEALRPGRWIVTAVWDDGNRDIRTSTFVLTAP